MTENFIPFYKHQFKEYLINKLEKEEKENFEKICNITESIYHYKYHSKLEKIKEDYEPYDPDTENNIKQIEKFKKKKEHESIVISEIKELLKAGNYEEISHADLEKAFEEASPLGINLKIDFSKYKDYSIFYRGMYNDTYEKKLLLKKQKYDFDVYSRVVFIFAINEGSITPKEEKKLKNLYHDKIYIKIFKNVPKFDLEMIFPGTKVQIKMVDKMKVVIPLAVGIVSSISNIIKYILSHGDPIKLLYQIGFWTLIGGFFMFSLKSFMNYKNTVEKYLKTLTQNLYFQNLDNNSGVVKNLIDDAEEQDWKEAITAYLFLVKENKPILSEDLNHKIETFFKEELDTDVFFEIDDALRKLFEFEIIEKSEGKIKAVGMDEALRKLNLQWNGFYN